MVKFDSEGLPVLEGLSGVACIQDITDRAQSVIDDYEAGEAIDYDVAIVLSEKILSFFEASAKQATEKLDKHTQAIQLLLDTVKTYGADQIDIGWGVKDRPIIAAIKRFLDNK